MQWFTVKLCEDSKYLKISADLCLLDAFEVTVNLKYSEYESRSANGKLIDRNLFNR